MSAGRGAKRGVKPAGHGPAWCPAIATALLVGCVGGPAAGPTAHRVERLREPVHLDGRLDEGLYARAVSVKDFVVASRPGAERPETKAWLQWDERGLWFAFHACDRTPVSSPPSGEEHVVDVQDRVEVFLWPERSNRYFCMEIAPEGAVHDYSAVPYRKFDDAWAPAGATFAATRTLDGYAVEGFVPVSALREMGIARWKAGTRFHVGLFRADFRPGAPDDPLWLTWVDPGLPQPDFHVRAAFAPIELAP